ncbi:MAG: biopolymer transporter ExbD [Bdellovibrionales bacterium]|nr:biopolymer transporter ExbD [Bdellovibrionales bacterium]
MAHKEKSLDNEVNLVPFISLLSVLICSLLLSAVWIQIGAMEVKQSVGGQAQTDSKKNPVVFARFLKDGDVEFRLKDAGKISRKLKIVKLDGIDGKLNIEATASHIGELVKQVPGLNMALIQPNSDSLYENIIKLMDQFRENGVADLGISPL